MHRFWFLLILFFYSSTLSGQNPGKYKLQKISIEKGLSQSVVTGITQDSLGFMWFSTLDGVNRYDGYHFVNYYHQKDDPFSLSNNFANAILCDNDNEIWVATLNGLCRFDYRTERFTVFRNEASKPVSISSDEISCLALSKTGNIWVGTTNGGINLFDKKRKTFSHMMHIAGNPGSILSDNISALCEDHKGNLWVGHYYDGLDYIDVKSGKVFHIKIAENKVNSGKYNHIRCLYQDPYGNIWIGTHHGLVRFDTQSNKFQFFNYDPLSPCSINGNIIASITSDSKNNLWVGTEENGLNIIHLPSLYQVGNRLCFNQIRMRENEYGLSIRSVYSIYEDRDRNVWIGTYSGGINFVSSVVEKFQKYQHNPYDKGTISYPKVMSVCEDRHGNIWIGTDGAGLDVLNTSTNKMAHYEHQKNIPGTISDNAILCALKDHQNNLWFGTYAGGLNRFNENLRSFTVYKPIPGDTNSFAGNDVRTLYEDHLHQLWIGTNAGGICRYNPEKNNFTSYNISNSRISINDIRALLGDDSGNLYIGTYGKGIDVFNTKTGAWRNYSTKSNPSNSVSDNYIYAFAWANNGDIWVGTGNGLNLFHTTSGTFETFNERNGLVNNVVHAILTDKHGDLWVSTNKGISKFMLAEKKFQNYDVYDGLQNGEFNDRSALYAQNGTMWFGGINGLNSFDPEKVSKSSFLPKVVFSGFQLYNTVMKARTPENPQSPLGSSISTEKKIELSFKQSVFTIDFVALNFSYPEKTQYAYRLDGLESEWNVAGNHRSATYRDLKAGHYVFEVKASNQDGIWSEKPASIEIIVHPPFWKTWWAYVTYCAFIFLLIYLIYNYYKQQAALKNKLLLETISHQKDLELNQERFRFFTNISHEFRTPLTLILGPIEELLEKEDQKSIMGRKFLLIYKNAHKLLDLINMLLDFRKVETGHMEIRIAKGDLVKFTSDFVNTFTELALQKGIALSFRASAETLEAWFDREKFEIIYNNLLSNAFKFTPKGGRISVVIEERMPQFLDTRDEIIAIHISDTGIGIAGNHIHHIFDSYYSLEHSEGIKGTGIGLALTKSLVEIHHGQIAAISSEGQGSSFIIEIRKGNAHFPSSKLSDNSDEFNKPYQTARKKFDVFFESTSSVIDHVADADSLADKKIMLIVEDNEDVRQFIADSFSDKYTLLQAVSGAEGYKLACLHVPDIIISDVMMPEMDGIEFCRKIKTNMVTCHIPVILLTARASITHKKEGYETGADSYVTKPFSVDLLMTRVENLLKSRKQLKEYYTRAMPHQPFTENGESPDAKFMKQIIGLIEKNMADADFDVLKLAVGLNMSRPVLYRKVKALTDLSIVELIRTIRLKKAAQLLQTGQYKVSDAALEVGITDFKYFRECFKEQFNITPSDFIRNANIKPSQED